MAAPASVSTALSRSVACATVTPPAVMARKIETDEAELFLAEPRYDDRQLVRR